VDEMVDILLGVSIAGIELSNEAQIEQGKDIELTQQ